MDKFRLKRHSTFFIREGWIEKAMHEIKANQTGKSIFGKEVGVTNLGIGANMVSSLRYWMVACGLLDSKTSDLTEFGEILYAYDQYLEDIFSWWMIHLKLLTNHVDDIKLHDAPVFYAAFNEFDAKNFKKNTLIQWFEEYEYELGFEASSEANVESDVSVFLKTYIEEPVDNPEDNLSSPLGKLGLLKKVDRDTYEFTKPDFSQLNYLIVYYSLILCLKNKSGNRANSINIDDLCKSSISPVKLFNLNVNMLNRYLEQMKQHELITLNKTAGLNMIYINEGKSEREIFEEYFKEKTDDIF